MTAPLEMPDDRVTDPQSSLLPAADTNIRVRPAQFARMVGVSKQTVSCWIRDGKVTLGPDGRLNPAKACDEVLRHSDPSRLRAKVLRPLVDDVATLRRQIQERDRRIEEMGARINYLDGFWREIEAAEEYLITQLVPARWDILRTLGADQISGALDDLMDEALLAVGYGIETDDDIPLQEEPDPELEMRDAETDSAAVRCDAGHACPGSTRGVRGAPLTHEGKQYDDENGSD